MKWVWLTLLGVLGPLLVAAAVGLALARPGLPIAAQKAMDAYLAQQEAVQGGAALRVEAAQRAAHPQAFVSALSRASYGGSYYFADGGRPVPFPPTEAWCVTLAGAGEPGAASTAHTVFVAQHEDIYVGTWLVHEPRSAEAVAAVCG